MDGRLTIFTWLFVYHNDTKVLSKWTKPSVNGR